MARRFHPGTPVHWKRWADGRPFVWLDDEITDADRRWVAENHPGPARLHRVDPFTGLTDADIAAISGSISSAPSGSHAAVVGPRGAPAAGTSQAMAGWGRRGPIG